MMQLRPWLLSTPSCPQQFEMPPHSRGHRAMVQIGVQTGQAKTSFLDYQSVHYSVDVLATTVWPS